MKIFILVLLLPILLELAIRFKLNYFPETKQPLDQVVTYHPKLGWFLKNPPGISPEDKILVLGGSFTYGDGVSRNEAWPGRFKYAANLGVSAYGVDQMYLTYLEYSSKFAGDKVFIGLIENNLVRTARSHFPFTGYQKPQFDKKMNLKNVPVPLLDYRKPYFDWNMFFQFSYSEVLNLIEKDKYRIETGYKIGLNILGLLGDRIKLNGKKPFIVFLAPFSDRIRIESFLAEKNISFADCSGYYGDSAFHISKNDMHPNSAGHKWISECVRNKYNL